MWRVLIVLMLGMGFLAGTAWAGDARAAPADCSTASGQADRALVRQAEGVMDAAANAAMQDMSTDVPVPERADILVFKDALAAAADHGLACESSPTPDAHAVEVRLAALLGANKPAATQAQDASGAGLIVRVREAWGTPEWLLVRIGFPVGGCCIADDNLLLVYARRDGYWRRVLRLQSKEYAEVSGAWGDFFDYLVLPAEGGRPRRIVIAHGRPWPMSCWSGFAISVFEPDSGRDSARRIFHVDHGYRRCRMKPQLTRTADGFELDAWLGAWGMPSVMHEGLFRYRAEKDTYVRVQPVAFDPQGFVGAWVDLPWPVASQWSSYDMRVALGTVHADLQSRHGFDWVTYGGVEGCPDDIFQIGLDLEMVRLNTVLSKRTVQFRVRADGNDVFTMLSSSAEPDPACVRKIAMRSN